MMAKTNGDPPMAEADSAPPIEDLNADRAAWLQARLRALIETTSFLYCQKAKMVSADAEMAENAIEGAIRGQAREITRIMGYRPATNLEPFTADGTKRLVPLGSLPPFPRGE